MNTRILRILAIALTVCVFAHAAIALAQETTATPEPPPTVEGTATPPIANDDNAPEETTVPIPTSTLNLAMLIAGVVFVAGRIIKSIEDGRIDKRTKDDAERLFNALPPGYQGFVLSILGHAQKIIDFLEDVTDGEPNEDEPPIPATPQTVTTTTTTTTADGEQAVG